MLASSLSFAQLVFQFEQDGSGNTVVTGSGSATTLPDKGHVAYRWIGFLEPPAYAPPPGEILQTQAVPSNWVPSPTYQNVFTAATPATSATLLLQYQYAIQVNYLGYNSGSSTREGLSLWPWYYVPGSTYMTLSGQAVFPNPLTQVFDLHAPGTVLVVLPGVLHFVIGTASPVPALPTAASVRRDQPTYYVTDVGAIHSVHSGLTMGLINQQVFQAGADAALRDLNGRLFRARSEEETETVSTVERNRGDSSLLRYFSFVAGEHMSYKVALGLADPDRRALVFDPQVGDRVSSGSPLGGGGVYAMTAAAPLPFPSEPVRVEIVDAAPSGKLVLDDEMPAIAGGQPTKRWQVFAAGDFSVYDQDVLGDLMEGFDTHTYAGSVGMESRVNPWLNLGLAWSYLQSDTDASGGLGNIDAEGNFLSGYATVWWRQYWADLLYSYGMANSATNRNTGFGGIAHGDADGRSNNLRLNFGRNFQLGGRVTSGPIAGLRYSEGNIDPYSETGGGTAALNFSASEFESMISRIGWQTSYTCQTARGHPIMTQAHLAWEHEYMPENGVVRADLQNSPFAAVTGGQVQRFGSFGAQSGGGEVGSDWMSAGVGLRFHLGKGLGLLMDYEGSFFRSDATQHYGSIKVNYEW